MTTKTRKKVLTKKEYHVGQLVGDRKETKGYIVLTYEYHKEGTRWVANCLELGTSTFAKNLIQAKERIRDAVSCHLNCLEEVGERERFFAENNIRFYSDKPRKNLKVDIPANSNSFYQSTIQKIPALVG